MRSRPSGPRALVAVRSRLPFAVKSPTRGSAVPVRRKKFAGDGDHISRHVIRLVSHAHIRFTGEGKTMFWLILAVYLQGTDSKLAAPFPPIGPYSSSEDCYDEAATF